MTTYINIDDILSGDLALAVSVATAFTQADDALVALRRGELYAGISSVTLSSDSFTISASFGAYRISAQSGVTDNLQAINGSASATRILMLTAASGHTITIRHGLSNIRTASGVDLVLSGDRTALFWRSGTNWVEIGAPNPASVQPDILEIQFFS